MLGKHKESKKEVAIKFMDISENCKNWSFYLSLLVSSADMIHEIYREAENMKKVNHKNVI